MSPGSTMNMESKKIMSFLEEFRVLECSCCSKVFGFQHKNTKALYCIGGCHENANDKDGMARILETIPKLVPQPAKLELESVDRVDGGSGTASDLANKLKELKVVKEVTTGPKPAAPPKDVAPPKTVASATLPAPKATVTAAPKATVTAAAPKAAATAAPTPPKPIPRHLCTDMKYSPNILRAGAKVRVLFAWTPTNYTVAAEEDDPAMNDLTDKLKAYALKAKPLIQTPILNEVVISEYEGGYYRARIAKVKGDTYELVFIDYGDMKVCKQADMYPMTDEFFKIPVYGLIVQLRLPVSAESLELSGALEETVYGDTFILDLINKKVTPIPGQADTLEARLWDLEKEATLNEKITGLITAGK